MIAALLGTIVLIWLGGPAHSGGPNWFAVAIAPDGAVGWDVKPVPDKHDAEEEAFRNCAKASRRPRDCEVSFVPAGSCIAIVRCTASGNISTWSGIAPSLKDAFTAATVRAASAHVTEANCKDILHGCPR